MDGGHVVLVAEDGRIPPAADILVALTGYEQVRSVTAELAGDYQAARRVELVISDTCLLP